MTRLELLVAGVLAAALSLLLGVAIGIRRPVVDQCGASRSIDDSMGYRKSYCLNRVGHSGRHGPWSPLS